MSYRGTASSESPARPSISRIGRSIEKPTGPANKFNIGFKGRLPVWRPCYAAALLYGPMGPASHPHRPGCRCLAAAALWEVKVRNAPRSRAGKSQASKQSQKKPQVFSLKPTHNFRATTRPNAVSPRNRAADTGRTATPRRCEIHRSTAACAQTAAAMRCCRRALLGS